MLPEGTAWFSGSPVPATTNAIDTDWDIFAKQGVKGLVLIAMCI